MKVAILGSNGFVGKSLHNLLQDKFNIIPVTRQTLNLTIFHEVDNWLKLESPDVIINCATAGGKQALSKQEVNYNELQNNLAIFLNFYNSPYTKKFINVGSGAEFEKTNNIENIDESKIFEIIPIDSYSYSKNLISRLVLEKSNFYTLRLFGCFGNLESEFRLFKRLSVVDNIDIVDRYFDYISITDFKLILEYYIRYQFLPKDMNCVYKAKFKLSEIVKHFINVHKLKTTVNIVETSKLNYTGSSYKLDNLGIFLEGLDSGIERYYL